MYLVVNRLKKSWDDFVLELGFSVRRGEVLAILGPSGAGKSTLLRMVAGLVPCDAGEIVLDGQDVAGLPPQDRGIGMVFQDFGLFGHLGVGDNVGYGLKLRGVPAAERQRRVADVLGAFGLEGFEDRAVGTLSGGEQQRVALARSLVVDPRLMLFDEPLGSLDASLRKELRREIRRLQQERNQTCLIVTHDQEDALAIADQILVMRDGRVVGVGRPEELWDNPGHGFVAEFLGAGTVVPVLAVEAVEGLGQGAGGGAGVRAGQGGNGPQGNGTPPGAALDGAGADLQVVCTDHVVTGSSDPSGTLVGAGGRPGRGWKVRTAAGTFTLGGIGPGAAGGAGADLGAAGPRRDETPRGTVLAGAGGQMNPAPQGDGGPQDSGTPRAASLAAGAWLPEGGGARGGTPAEAAGTGLAERGQVAGGRPLGLYFRAGSATVVPEGRGPGNNTLEARVTICEYLGTRYLVEGICGGETIRFESGHRVAEGRVVRLHVPPESLRLVVLD